jgi:GT2 family glycosyltransferase
VPEPLLSIVTPSLNQGRYVGQCLGSVAAEMLSPRAHAHGVEHIVMDGGSTDETVGHLERATHLAHWQSGPDGGQSAAINRGLLDHARGTFATWINADDWFEPAALGRMLERLSRPDAPDVLVGRCRFVEDGRTIFAPRPPEPIDMASLLQLRSKWFAGRLIVQPEAFFRRSLFERVGGLNESNHFTMDHELWLKLLEAGARFEVVDHPVACMRVHEAQKTADNRRIVESLIRFGRPFLERHQGQLGERGAGALAEVDGMARKLDASEALVRRLRLPWTQDTTQPAVRAAPPEAPEPDEFHLAPLRAVLSGVPSRPDGARRRYRAHVVGKAPVSKLPVRLAVRARPPYDLVLLWNALGSGADALAVLTAAVEGLRPGGLVVAASELAGDGQGLKQYAEGLARIIDRQLSENHDWLIDPSVGAWVEAVARGGGAGDAQWRAWHPNPFGIDLAGLMAGAGLEPVSVSRYGGTSWHPLTPFPAVEGVEGRDRDQWACGVWRKPVVTG